MTLDSLSGSAFGADEFIAVHVIWTQLEGMFISYSAKIFVSRSMLFEFEAAIRT